jgi:von Willebrand factor type A domain
VIDWILKKLADRLGVAPPSPGEKISPYIRLEQPWSQTLLVFTVVGAFALIAWLYRHEGRTSAFYKIVLASLRIMLVLLAMFMLSEAVLSVQRTGLPNLTIMVDDSASEAIVDQYETPEERHALEVIADSATAPTVPARPDSAGKTNKPSLDVSTTVGGSADNGVPRLSIAKGLILQDRAKLLRELQGKYRVRIYRVSNSAQPVTEVDRAGDLQPAVAKVVALEAAGTQTRLGDGVRQVLTELRGAPPAAIVMFTDGQTTEGEPLSKVAELAARKGVPLYTVGLGSAEPARDLELTELLVDDVVFVEDAVRFQAKLSARGFAGQKVVVRLKERDGNSADPKSERDLETKEIEAPPDGQPGRIELVHRPKTTGERTFIVEVEPKPRELQTDNNRIERVITVRKEKLKVLYVDSEPRYEFRYLKNYLERDESIDLNVVLLSSDPEYSEQDRSALPTFPASKDDLFGYDVVIFGDADTSFLSLSQMQNLVQFVTEKGGGVLFVAGELFNPLSYRGTPLELLLPIELSADAHNPTAVGAGLSSYRPELTLEGRANPIFRLGDNEVASMEIWNRMPELYWYFEAPRKKPAAQVLAEHPTVIGPDGKLPLIVYQFLGSGKVMFHAFDDSWRWRFRAGDRFFGRFWVQTIRFMARSRLIGNRQAEIQTDRRRYQRGQPIQLRVRFLNPGLAPAGDDVTVQVQRKDQGPRKLALKLVPGTKNLFEGAMPQAAEGEYEVRLLPPPTLERPITAGFRVDPPINERERIEMNQPELIRAASVSGGKFYTPLTVGTLLKDLPAPENTPLDTDPPIPLWNTWPVLALFLTLITLEWVLRKRKQMV